MLETIARMLLQSKQTKFINDRLHLVVVHDGEVKEIIGKKVTFFDIQSTKAKQFGFMMELDQDRKLTCCGDEPYNEENEKYALKSDYLLHEAFCLYDQAVKIKILKIVRNFIQKKGKIILMEIFMFQMI